MPPTPPTAPYWTALFPLVIVALVILRNSQARRLRIESLWIAPAMILLLVGLALGQQGIPSPAMLALDLAALALGAGIGWWRARFTQISVNPETHELTSKASPLGMLVILAVFAVRFGVRMFATQGAGVMGVSANAIADAALVISVGLVCAQRLEIALRASRLLNEARAATITSS